MCWQFLAAMSPKTGLYSVVVITLGFDRIQSSPGNPGSNPGTTSSFADVAVDAAQEPHFIFGQGRAHSSILSYSEGPCCEAEKPCVWSRGFTAGVIVGILVRSKPGADFRFMGISPIRFYLCTRPCVQMIVRWWIRIHTPRIRGEAKPSEFIGRI